MKNKDETRKEIFSPDTEEVVKILERLDKSSMILAKTYMTALADKQELENAKLAIVVI